MHAFRWDSSDGFMPFFHSLPAGVNIFAHAKLFFPIATGRHWSLIVASMQTLRGGPGSGTLEYYDSSADRIPLPQVYIDVSWNCMECVMFSLQREQFLEKIKGWIEKEGERLHCPIDSAKWISTVVIVPEQTVECDSGVMMLAFVDMVRKMLLVDVNVISCDHLRYNFALEIFSSADK